MRAIKTTTISILAVGLLAGSAVGTAAQDGAMVTGSVLLENCGTTELGQRAVREECVDAVVEASDERLSGTTDLTSYGVEDGDGEGYDLATFGTDVFRLVNEGGAWSGQGTSIFLIGEDRETIERTWVLTGEDGYEGLSAYLKAGMTDPFNGTLDGVIIEGTLAVPPAE